jgi:hypothetical protein
LGDGCLVRQIDADKLNVDATYRSVFLPAARYFEPEILQVFDGASASLVVGDRAETNVPAQALFLLNNEFAVERARHAAERLLGSGQPSTTARIERLYRQVLTRGPSPSELHRATEYIDAATGDAGSGLDRSEVDVWAGLVQSLFASAEFRYLY